MTNQNIDLDNLQAQWQSIGRKPAGTCPPADFKPIRHQASQTRRLYRRFMMLGIMGMLFPLLILQLNQMTPLSLLLIVSYSIFGILCGICNFMLAYKIQRFDLHFIDRPVIEAVEFLTQLIRLRRNIRWIMMVLCVPVIALLLYELWLLPDKSVFIGGVVGALIGAPIGFMVNARIAAELQQLLDIYQKALDNAKSDAK